VASDHCEILMLHRVLPDEPCAFGLPSCYRIRGTALTPVELRRLVESSLPILELEQVEQALGHGTPPPRGSVLTFDDGYREHCRGVSTILAELDAPAVFYVCASLHAESEAVSVVDAWYWLIDNARQPQVELHLPDGSRLKGRLDQHDHKRAWVCGAPKAALLTSSRRDQWKMISQLAEAVDQPLPTNLSHQLYMSREDWTSLERMGHRIGAHGVHHQHLTSLGPSDLERELAISMGAVPSGAPLAYPDGAFDNRVVEATIRANASSAVTCEPGYVRAGSDLFRLPRHFVRPETTA
jgi:peptidoglycan/xylan/chitin deacetylase (PgdA/CDA1 family)